MENPAGSVAEAGGASGALDHVSRLGAQLRLERNKRELSVRELARRIGVSASLVSQIETGRVQPSVTTLMALVTELGLSLDNLFSDSLGTTAEERPSPPAPAARAEQAAPGAPSFDVGALLPPTGSALWSKSSNAPPPFAGQWASLGVERAGHRAYLELESGVRWERLTPNSLPGMEFLYVRYEVGASSTASGKHTRHQGIEFGYVTSGSLHVTVGFDEIVLESGDSLMFDAATPHRLENRGGSPAEAVWLIIGRNSIASSPGHREG